MVEISQPRLEEVERCKAIIGWGWMELSSRLGWSNAALSKFRTLKDGIPEEWLAYLRAVAEAVEGVPVPTVGASVPRDDTEQRMRQAGLGPASDLGGMTEVKVMTLQTIAEKLVAEYRALQADPELSGAERSGALAAVGRVAQRLGVLEEVKAVMAASPVSAPAAGARPWGPPQPAAGLPSRQRPPITREPMTEADEEMGTRPGF